MGNTKKKEISIAKKMIVSLVGGIAVGLIFMMVRQNLLGSGEEATWKMINDLLFQDITSADGVKAIGIFYIIGQLFMKGLQAAIVPLVLVSLSLALCSISDSTKLGLFAVTFIATAAGIPVTPANMIVMALLSICAAAGTPAIPIAGTTMIFTVLSGMGWTTDVCLLGYALVVAVNRPVEMSLLPLNVIGDAAVNVIVNASEGQLNKDIYNS